ncbi:hypothetical protein CEXT_114311 [Caerostris extrusa]|uniref:Uncharacterized protein n=1 Tax=Caerostris extrusa TaxID=172846 RepID=A0AAV4Y7Z5_CAEEX|nr:hypothetical protein CEXT_114311 [Caerostris extrusa]
MELVAGKQIASPILNVLLKESFRMFEISSAVLQLTLQLGTSKGTDKNPVTLRLVQKSSRLKSRTRLIPEIKIPPRFPN